MIRAPLQERGVGSRPGFRWRGGDVSRLEGFSDAVFGFALTLLVVSLEVPQTFGELMTALRGFGSFAICFFMLTWVWYRHYLFFRRYGMEDGYVLVLNSLLLFVVLFYVYPLKFMYGLFAVAFAGGSPAVHLPDGRTVPRITGAQMPALFTIYGLGFAAIFLIFALLYLHAYRRRATLELEPLEINDTLESVWSSFGLAAVGVLSSVVVLTTRSPYLAGVSYGLIPVVEMLVGMTMARRGRRLEAAASQKNSSSN